MKKLIFVKLVLIIWFTSISTFAQNTDKDIFYIKSTRFASPLIEKWIAEYAKINPDIRLKLSDSNISPEDISLNVIISDNAENALQANEQVLYFGRYAILPVTGKENPLLEKFEKKRLNDKQLKDLFFEKEIPDNGTKRSKPEDDITVYSGNNAVSVTQSFASYFGYTPSELKGKKISGDDVFLLHAIQKDSTGITFNALGNIFDINTRKLKNRITLLPLDIKKEYREYFSDSSDMDRVIKILESQTIDLIPVQDIGFIYHSEDRQVKEFLIWVLSEGTSYNHGYGILNPEERVLASQIKKIEEKLYTSLRSE